MFDLICLRFDLVVDCLVRFAWWLVCVLYLVIRCWFLFMCLYLVFDSSKLSLIVLCSFKVCCVLLHGLYLLVF